MKVKFDSPAERDHHHQHIREGAREVSDDTDLLRALFHLENGKEEQSRGGVWLGVFERPTIDRCPIPTV
jgi:hypothetical protein